MISSSGTIALSRQRCVLHVQREAAARCPACSRFYCRECVTEHEGRFLCATCLRARSAAVDPKDPAVGRWRRAVFIGGRRGTAFVLSLGLLWWAFQLFGQMLARLPASFHEGTVWGK